MAATVVGVLVLILGVVLATPGGDEGRWTARPLEAAGGAIARDQFNGSVAGSVSTPLVVGDTGADNTHNLQAPGGATRMQATIDWTPASGGTDLLEILVTRSDGKQLLRKTGGPGFAIELVDADLGWMGLHYQVVPADDVGLVVEQAFTISTTFWDA